MYNPNIIYSVTGRYMDGQKIVAYHLVGSDGSQEAATKDRVSWLIGRNMIDNMKIQAGSNGNIILRGKGINLSKLPVFDMNKQEFRSNQASVEVANSNVSTKKSNVPYANAMGQFEIVKRIMFKNKCIGYELHDRNGKHYRKRRQEVLKLAVGKLICNAGVQKYTDKNSGETVLILRGAGTDLSKLPILIVNDNGMIYDPSKASNDLTVRGAYMKSNGIVRDGEGHSLKFRAGEFIICNADGKVSIVGNEEAKRKYTTKTDCASAVCDDYLSNISKYSIEIFGNSPISLSAGMVKRWTILKPVGHGDKNIAM